MLFHSVLPTTLGSILPVLWMRKLRLRPHGTCPGNTVGERGCLSPGPGLFNHVLLGQAMCPDSCHSHSSLPWTLWRNKDRKGDPSACSQSLCLRSQGLVFWTCSQSSCARRKAFGLAALIVGCLFCPFLYWSLVFSLKRPLGENETGSFASLGLPPTLTHCESQGAGKWAGLEIRSKLKWEPNHFPGNPFGQVGPRVRYGEGGCRKVVEKGSVAMRTSQKRAWEAHWRSLISPPPAEFFFLFFFFFALGLK